MSYKPVFTLECASSQGISGMVGSCCLWDVQDMLLIILTGWTQNNNKVIEIENIEMEVKLKKKKNSQVDI